MNAEMVSFPVTREFETDVLVVGGGVAGFAAAVSAGRTGAKVLLTDSGGCLGGTATKGLVGPFMTCKDAKGEVRIIRGLFSELVDRLIEDGGAISPDECPGADSHSAYRPYGHIGVTPFDPESLKRVTETMCLEAGVKLLYHATLIGCETDGRRIVRAFFAMPDEIVAVRARQFIDTTGSAALCAKAGARTFRGDEEGFTQTASTFFRVTGVDKEMLDRHCAEVEDMEPRYYMKEIARAREEGRFPCGTRKVRLFESLNGVWFVNMAQEDDPLNELDGEAVTEAEIRQRKQIPMIVQFLRDTVPAMKNIVLVDSAESIGVRESRRMVGRTLFTREDVVEGRFFDDRIAVCANSIDIHQKSRVSYTTHTGKSYTIPLSCLISADMDNLTAAGKCLSADKFAFAAVRVMPPCIAMGEAVGILSAYASARTCAAADVPYTDVQKELLARGGYLG